MLNGVMEVKYHILLPACCVITVDLHVRDVVVWWGSVVGSSDREKQHEQDASMTTVCNIFCSTCGVVYNEARYELPLTNAECFAPSYILDTMDNSYPIIVHANWYHLNLLPYQRNIHPTMSTFPLAVPSL